MKTLALLLALLVCLPSVASAVTQQQAVYHLKQAGVQPDLEVRIFNTFDPYYFNGVFIAPGCYDDDLAGACFDHPIIGLAQGTSVPDDVMYLVLFHEYTHYLQWIHGWHYPSRIAMEQDADAGAVNMFCQAGFDGVGAMGRWVTWESKHGYFGDSDHGSTIARFVYAKAHAKACKVDYQAP